MKGRKKNIFCKGVRRETGNKILIYMDQEWSVCVAQSVKVSDFSSGHDLTVCKFELCFGICALLWDRSLETASDSVSPFLCSSLAQSLSFSLSLSLSLSKTDKNLGCLGGSVG